MKILYAIQGTGNGHLSRARDIIPLLMQKADVDILISGEQADVAIPYPITYRFKGLGFVFGKKGGIDLLSTYKKANLKRLFKEISSLPVEKYDLVISDFEPVSAWACYRKNKACIALSHQAAVLNKNAPQPGHADPLGKAILKNYCPTTFQYGFHFKAYDKHIFTPVIRSAIRNIPVTTEKHYTVYLPAYDDERIVKVLSLFKGIEWQVFSKHNKKVKKYKNIVVAPISNESFIQSMASCRGVLCGAGFETPAEALFMQKKLLVIPMKGQYEQQCNAAALAQLGIPVIKSLKKKHEGAIGQWLASEQRVTVHYPDITQSILDDLLARASELSRPLHPGSKIASPKKLRQLTLKRIIVQLVK
ncbi:MAG: glycosyltransferase family protein [Chitinophagaceae bacterium]